MNSGVGVSGHLGARAGSRNWFFVEGSRLAFHDYFLLINRCGREHCQNLQLLVQFPAEASSPISVERGDAEGNYGSGLLAGIETERAADR